MKMYRVTRKIVLLCLLLMQVPSFSDSSEKMAFWSVQKRGANGALHKFRPEWFKAAADVGLEFIRFAPDKLPAAERDFLIGNADHFTSLNETDFALLGQILDIAHHYHLKIVLVMYSLPGCRWRQHNDDVDDSRIWQDEYFQEQAFAFWRQLAFRLKNFPAIVAYNPLNEPHPEQAFGFEEPTKEFVEWFEKYKNTTADLNKFNRLMLAAIRSVDPDTPVMLDGYFFADVKGMPFNEPVDDVKTLYTFHNIAPWQFAAFRINKGRYSYPDKMPNFWDAPGVPWRFVDLENRVDPVVAFSAKHDIPAHRIIASEFWCDRRVPGCKEYLTDAITIYNFHQWHWAFYDFRSDGNWGGLDYELGTEKLDWKFWQAVENGEDGEPFKNRHDNPIWHVLQKELSSP
ncbi:glycosyl hydrolase family 5 [candidate division KSB1 bacterium]|nr:cellulase family glycosylhydrolase [candidate division KSB1 bacterium]RQW06459.1 MAG: glycosyl hydrolase family 5 [candidate division KSB1 bacterium]